MKISNFRSTFLSVFWNQLSSLPEKQFVKNYFSQKTSTLYKNFRAWTVNFRLFWPKTEQVVYGVSRRRIREEHSLGKENKIWQFSDVFPGFRPKILLGVVKIAILMSKGAY